MDSRQINASDVEYVFGLFDRNGDGNVSLKDLEETLASLGQTLPKNELESMINDVDSRGSGTNISFKDFYTKLHQKIKEMSDIRESIVNALRTFDVDGKGFVSKENIRTIFTNYFEDVSQKELDRLIRKSRRNEFGDVNYEDLITNFLYPV